MRKPFIAANWKMNLTTRESVTLAETVSRALTTQRRKIDVVLCPSFTALSCVARSKNKLALGAQDYYYQAEGAFTGAIAARQIKEFCDFVIVGHSERRQYFLETDAEVNQKISTALQNRLTPILCVGESWSQRRRGETKTFVGRQVRAALKGLSARQLTTLVIAYEPIWAIGTGKSAEAKDAEEMAFYIRQLVSRLFTKKTADALRILYGGSVTPANAAEFFQQENIDGGLVGGASLIAHDFVKIAHNLIN